ncbi:MAG: CAP domain-containing protein [Desulfocapsaceae bacterium]|nr:CAP domain-containing protein [Desulfocapsaceae bacterium]
MAFVGVFLWQGISLSAAERLAVQSDLSGSRVSLTDAEKVVALHNKIRAEVGVGPLRWSEELAAYAQRWADHLAISGCGIEHRPRSGKWRQEYGENLFIGTASHYGTADAVMAWAKEKSNYRGDAIRASRFPKVGHYTQIVWRDTKQIGCGTGLCRGNLIVVCNYNPPGNFLGQKPY